MSRAEIVTSIQNSIATAEQRLNLEPAVDFLPEMTSEAITQTLNDLIASYLGEETNPETQTETLKVLGEKLKQSFIEAERIEDLALMINVVKDMLKLSVVVHATEMFQPGLIEAVPWVVVRETLDSNLTLALLIVERDASSFDSTAYDGNTPQLH